jgi:hypothetical protein
MTTAIIITNNLNLIFPVPINWCDLVSVLQVKNEP